MLLFKTEADALQVYRDAEQAANELSLQLNAEKSSVISLTEPFRFVGFEFRPEQGWKATPTAMPCQLEDLGWEDSSAQPDESVSELKLPGEQSTTVSAESSLVIVGPGLRRLDVQDKRLTWQYTSSSQAVAGRQIKQISQIIVLGLPR